MNFKRWKLAAGIAMFCGLLTAGAGLTDGMHWRGFVAVLCVSVGTNFANFLAKHPVEEITDSDSTKTDN